VTDAFHYPPDILELLVNTVPLLCRSKRSVVLFLQGAGVDKADLAEVDKIVRTDPDSINKFEIVRRVLTKVNARGDSGLRPRREIIKRVTEFESFETCWPQDQYKAKGLVASLREAVNAKDSFTRMKQERDAERSETLARRRAEIAAVTQRRARIAEIGSRLGGLFGMDHKPQERGTLLESVLNDLFEVYGIQVREAFRRKEPDGALVLEQIDGVIEIDGTIYLVEMKWLKDAVGVAEFFPHLSRLFLRANASGFFISNSGFTDAVVKECTSALSQKTMVLCSLREIVDLLQRPDGDLVTLLKTKIRSAIVDKDPHVEVS
jgi:Restriction endonuclease